MKLKELTTQEIKKRLKERSAYLNNEYKWAHEDKTYIALLNEYEKRVMKW